MCDQIMRKANFHVQLQIFCNIDFKYCISGRNRYGCTNVS